MSEDLFEFYRTVSLDGRPGAPLDLFRVTTVAFTGSSASDGRYATLGVGPNKPLSRLSEPEFMELREETLTRLDTLVAEHATVDYPATERQRIAEQILVCFGAYITHAYTSSDRVREACAAALETLLESSDAKRLTLLEEVAREHRGQADRRCGTAGRRSPS